MDVHPTKNVSIGIDPYPYGFMSVRALNFGKASEPRKWTRYIPKTRYTSFPAKDFNRIREVDAKGDDIYSLPGPHFALPKLL